MIAATDLLSPNGPADSSLFPGEESNVLEERMLAYITRAYADERIAAQLDLARKDNLARALALHFAFTAVHIRMLSEPITVNVTEKGGHGYAFEQVRAMKQLADKYLSDFLGLLVISPDTPSSQLPGSVSVRNTQVW